MPALLLVAVALMSAPDDAKNSAPYRIAVTLQASSLEVGPEYAFEVTFAMKKGWSAEKAGIPKPILQIDLPGSVRLSGKVLESHQELASNEFLQEPFERLLDKESEKVFFTLTEKPDPEDRVAFNFLAYISESKENSHFVRERWEIALTPDAKAKKVSAADSSWGQSSYLQLGQDAEPLTLPRADGSSYVMDEFLGEKNILVTTYRAFW